MDEATKNGDIAALKLRDQIIQDTKDNTLWDNMEWYEQGGYGFIAYLVDPLTLATGGLGKTALNAAPYAFKAAKTWQQVGANVGVSAARWSSVGAVEESARAGIRLAADETYTSKDAQMDIAVSMALGAALPTIGHGIKGTVKNAKWAKGIQQRWVDLQKQKQKVVDEFDAHNVRQTANTQPTSTEVVGDHVINSDTGEVVQPFKYTEHNDAPNLEGLVTHDSYGHSFADNVAGLDRRQIEAKIQDITAYNVIRRKLLDDPVALQAKANDVGETVEAMRKLTQDNYTNNENRKKFFQVHIGSIPTNSTPDIKFKNVPPDNVAPTTPKATSAEDTSIPTDLKQIDEFGNPFSDSFVGKDRRQIEVKIASMKEYQRDREILLRDETAMRAKAADVGESMTDMTRLIARNFENTYHRLRYYEAHVGTLGKADTSKIKFNNVKPDDVEPTITTPDDLMKVDAVSEEAINNQAKYYLRGMAKTDEDYKQVVANAGVAYLQKLDDSINKGQQAVSNYVLKDQPAFHGMTKTPADWLGDTLSLQWAGNLFTDVATRFQKSGLDSLEYVGMNITESGKGFGGKITRKHTAALIKDSYAKRSQGKLLPQYNNAINEYAASKGKSAYQRFSAEWQGEVNPTVKQFHNDVFRYQEARRLGKDLPDVHPSVAKYADDWDSGFRYAHDQMVKAELPNFTANRRVKNYIPRQWLPHKLHALTKQIGKPNVVRLLTKAFDDMNVRHGTSNTSNKGVEALLENIETSRFNKFKTVDEAAHDVDDAFTPTIDLHSRERLDLDMTTSIEVGGREYSLLDLINTELPEIATKYTERMSGYIGLAKATNGAINNPLDVKTFRQTVKNEAMLKGKSAAETNQALSMYDDVMDNLFGRPTRRFASEGTLSKAEQLLTGENYTGISKNLRQLKDLTALTQLGGLGAAQLAETGNDLVRLSMQAFNDPKVLRALYKKSGIDVDNPAELLRVSHEIMAQTGLNKDMRYLQRQSVHLDQQRKEELSKLGLLADTIVDMSTFGKHKAQASYALAKTTGFNAVREWQHEMAQSATTVDIVKHVLGGNGTMSTKRIKDLGLDSADLAKNIKQHVEVNSDGYPVAMNFDKWDDTALDNFTFGIHRDALQAVQQSLVGEIPAHLNRPLVQVALQYMEMPIVAMNKQLGRQVAFADKEAAVAMVLAGTVAGIVRYSWDYLNDVVAGDKRKVQDIDSMETLVNSDLFKAVQYAPHLAYLPNVLEHLSGKHGMPIMSTLDNMHNAAGEGLDLVQGEGSAKDFIDTAHRLVPLGTTIYAEGVTRLTIEMADNLEDE